MRAGSRTLHIPGATINDDGSSGRTPLDISPGWFFLRLLVELTATHKSDLGAHGIVFTAQRLLQPGWFKVYLNEEQVTYLRSLSTVISIFPIKKYVQPNFAELQGQTSFSVQATDDWSPAPPISAKKVATELFAVHGASAEVIYSDPKVASIQKHPKIVLH
jgi:hypothetical protein